MDDGSVAAPPNGGGGMKRDWEDTVGGEDGDLAAPGGVGGDGSGAEADLGAKRARLDDSGLGDGLAGGGGGGGMGEDQLAGVEHTAAPGGLGAVKPADEANRRAETGDRDNQLLIEQQRTYLRQRPADGGKGL